MTETTTTSKPEITATFKSDIFARIESMTDSQIRQCFSVLALVASSDLDRGDDILADHLIGVIRSYYGHTFKPFELCP